MGYYKILYEFLVGGVGGGGLKEKRRCAIFSTDYDVT